VALDEGGARETVIDGKTGILVPEPTAEAFASALNRALDSSFDLAAARANALRFSKQQFMASIRTALDEAIAEKSAGGRAHDAAPNGPPLVDFDAARVPPPSVKADRENK